MYSISVSDPVLQSEDPFVVRLLFEPSGRPDSQQDYYLTAKENLCVVCGKVDSYIRCDILSHLQLTVFISSKIFLSEKNNYFLCLLIWVFVVQPAVKMQRFAVI